MSAKRIKLEGSLPRRVHFNDNPVSDSVEIPRIPDGKHTRKKLQMSGYEQEMFVSRDDFCDENTCGDSQDSSPVYIEPASPVPTQAIFPELINSSENIATILHNLATGTWAKVLEADLKQNDITTIGQLAKMDSSQIKALRGVKPDKEVTVKNALKTFWGKIKRDDGVQSIRVRAPVEEETTQEEEDEIKAALFSRPSPSPTDLGEIESEKVDKEPESNEPVVASKPVEKENMGTITLEKQSLELENEQSHSEIPAEMSSSVTNSCETEPAQTKCHLKQLSKPTSELQNENFVAHPDLIGNLLKNEVDIADLPTENLTKLFENLGHFREQVDQLRNKVAHTIFSRIGKI